MPAFIKTPKDEARWAKAKEAANKSHSESEGDSYWAIVNSIYQKMKKSIDFAEQVDNPAFIDEAIKVLEKARQKMSDEYDPNEEQEEDVPAEEQLSEFDPDDESAGDEWLKENDPSNGGEYEEYGDDEDEDAHRNDIEARASGVAPVKGAVEGDLQEQGSPRGDRGASGGGDQTEAQEEAKAQGRFRQPSKEEITALRNYTRPWETRAREAQRLQADPSKNPELAHQGNIIEARNKYHGDRKNAYQQLTGSKDYQSADPIAQMEMDDKFENDWKSKNPDHMLSAMKAHKDAHEAGKKGQEHHANVKDAQIRHVISGGSGVGSGMSTEEALQGIGGIKGDEGGTEGAVKQDPAAGFAAGNQDFISQYAQDYANKGKKVGNIDDMENWDEGSKKDIGRILGPAGQKDPKFEQFFSHHHPLIGMSAKRVMNKLGLDHNNPDIDMSMLHEAGMHGLVQAINDYDHNNPSKASFSTHAGNKIRGLQMTALRNQDQIPSEVRQAQKKFVSSRIPGAPKGNDLKPKIMQSGHPKANDMADRLARSNTARAAKAVKIRRGPNPARTMPKVGSEGNGE